jgi:hypothetical protein
MEEFIAPLGLKVDATDPAKAAVALDQLTSAAGKAEVAANDLAGSSRKLSAAEKAVAEEAQRAMGVFSHLADEQAAVARTQDRLNSLHGTAIKNTAALNQATLNLGRQFTDIGVQLAGGQSPLLILIQQGPQVADALAMAKTQGVGLKAIIAETALAARGLLVTFAPWIAGLTAIGAAAWVVYDAYQKQAKAIEDTTKRLQEQDKALGQISPLLSQAKASADLAAEGQRNFDEWIRKTNTSLAEQIRLQRAAALNQTNEAALKAGENLRKAQEEFDRLNRPGARSGFSTGVGGFSTISAGGAINKETELYKKAAKNLEEATKAAEEARRRVVQQGQAPDLAFGKQTESVNRSTTAIRTATVATEDYRRAAAFNEDALIKASEEVWPYMAEVVQASEARVKALNDATQNLDRSLGNVRIPSDLENLATVLEDASGQARGLRFDIEDIADAINRNDWTSAFASLARVLVQVQNAFKQGADSATKFQAAAALAQGVGNIVGGSTGSAISATASGALTGFQLGGPVGAVIGGGLGLVSSLFGSSKAKKQQRAQEAAQRAAEEAQRQQTIVDTEFGLNVAYLRAQAEALRASGKEAEAATIALQATNMERDKERARLSAISQAAVDLQERLWALEEVATATAKAAEEQARWAAEAAKAQQDQQKIGLDLMALDDAVTGGNSAVLAARQIELAALDATSQELKRIYWARLDEGQAMAKQAEAARGYQEANIGLMRQLNAMDDAVLGTTSARDAARADELAKLDATGKALQTIIWAREDEVDALAKQKASQDAANEAAGRATEGYLSFLGTVETQAQAQMAQATGAANDLASSLVGVVNYGQEAADQFNALSTSLKDFADSIGLSVGGRASSASYLAARNSLFTSGGQGVITSGQAFLEASKSIYGEGSARYQADQLIVQRRASEAAAIAASSAVSAIASASTVGGWLRAAIDQQLAAAGPVMPTLRTDWSGLPAMANGGEFMVGGNTGLDQNLLSLNNVPVARVNYGEKVSVTPAGGGGDPALREEVAQLNRSMASMARDIAQMARNIDRVSQGGEALITTSEAA